ncbi:hypothetical protein C8J57DRAFT_1728301 [Mycena rebaudengoi]|nr:hypothetical protein C8J57DRAFT_1728301 [Mycena rebaudengoi]
MEARNPGRESHVVAGLAAKWATSPEKPNRLVSTPLIFNRTEAPPADTTKRDGVIAQWTVPAFLFRPRAPFNYASHALPYALPRPPVAACALPALQAALPVPSAQDEATFEYLGRSHALHLLAETHGVSAGRACRSMRVCGTLCTADVALRDAREFEQGSFEARMRALEYDEEDDAPTSFRCVFCFVDGTSCSICGGIPRTLSKIDADASEASFTPAKSKRKRDDGPGPDTKAVWCRRQTLRAQVTEAGSR